VGGKTRLCVWLVLHGKDCKVVEEEEEVVVVVVEEEEEEEGAWQWERWEAGR
jgi:hypothetical protein